MLHEGNEPTKFFSLFCVLISQLTYRKQRAEKMGWCETCSYKFGVMPRWLDVVIYNFGDLAGYLSFSDNALK